MFSFILDDMVLKQPFAINNNSDICPKVEQKITKAAEF